MSFRGLLSLSLFLSLLMLGSAVSRADHECPDKIQYTGGGYLKRGSDFYYRNGTYLLRDNNLYYPNGTYLKRGNYVYYPNGVYLQRDNHLYYPNGNYLKRNQYFYYSNGSYLKRDEYFYYSNGNYARRNGTLYRPDGSVTAFPITLAETIGTYGSLFAEVRKETEIVDVSFRDLVASADGTHVSGLWNGTSFSQFEMVLNTGVAGEDVFVRVREGSITCQLGGGPGPGPAAFTLEGRAAKIDVLVKPGYDPVRVRQVLQSALDSILR